jgi:rRNA-processing protein FCF1
VVRVLIDSNFLIAAIHFRIDLIQELEYLLGRKVEPVLISPVEEELRRMASGHEAMRSRDAAQALEVALRMDVEVVARLPNESVDDVLVRIASERGWMVATNDRLLRKRLDAIAVPTIYLRQRTRLEAKGVG